MLLEHWLIIYLKKVFIRKEKKINILTAFFIFHKNSVKTFLKWIVNQWPKSTRWYGPILFSLICVYLGSNKGHDFG